MLIITARYSYISKTCS